MYSQQPITTSSFNFFSSITRIWPLITGQVTGILSSSIFQTLTSLPNQTETGILTVLLGCFYILIDNNIRKIVAATESYRKNDIWVMVVNDWLDAFYRFWIFLTIQYSNSLVGNQMTGNDPSLLLQLIFVFSVVLVLILVVSIMEFLQEKMSNDGSSIIKTRISKLTLFGKNSIDVFLTVYNGMYGVVVQFYSDFLFSQVRQLPDNARIGVLSVVLLIFYLLIEHFLRGVLKLTEDNSKSSLMWKFIQKIFDFFVVFSIFFVVSYGGLLISSISDANQFGTYARFVALFSIYVLSYSLFAFLAFSFKGSQQQQQQQQYKKESDDVQSVWITAIGRIWPKISGTTTGLFANLIVSDVVTGSNQTQVLSLVINFLILWSICDPFIRHVISVYGDRNKLWRSVIFELLDFPVALCPLLIYTVVSNILNSQILSGQIGLLSQVVIIFSVQLVSICFFTTIKQLSSS